MKTIVLFLICVVASLSLAQDSPASPLVDKSKAVLQAQMRALGAEPKALDFSVAYQALKSGTVDGTDFGDFGSAFSQTVANSPFDFNADGAIDGTDFAQFGARFGMTL